MKRLLLALIILLSPVMALLPITTSNNSASAWYSNYAYRKCFVVNGSADGAQTNYQLKLTVNKSNGVSSGSTVYLDGNSLAWPYDFRFTNSSGGVLDYWIESNTSTEATVWVEFDSIVNGATNQSSFYIYFSKAGDTGASNGGNTFLFFDHFEGTSLDSSKWDEVNSPTISVAGSIIEITNSLDAWRGISTKSTFGAYNIRLVSKWKGAGVNGEGNQLAETITGWTGDMAAIMEGDSGGTPVPYVRTANEGAYTTTQPSGFTITSYNNKEITWVSGKVRYLEGSVLKQTHTTNIPNEVLKIFYTTYYKTNTKVSVDWVFVANYTSTEPTWGTWGSIESSSSYTLSVTGSPVGGGIPYFTGSSPFLAGSVVNIFANNSSCYTFTGWTPTTDIANPTLVNTSITMNANASLTANYVIKTFTLTYINGSNGGITGNLSQTVNCSANGTAVTAVPNACYYFVNWSDSSTTNPRTDTNVAANISVTANFGAYTYGHPTSITSSADSDSIILSWTKGFNTSSTYIRYKIGSYPTSITDGNIIGNASGYGYIHTGLLAGTSYYYKLWGMNGSCYSTTNATIFCTTTAGYSGGTSNPLPTTDTSGWNETPNGSALENNPLYAVVNMEADAIGIPHSTWWFLLGMGLLIIAGIFTYSRTDNLLLAVSVVIVAGGILASSLQIIPIWCIAVFGIYAITVSWKELR